MPPLIDDKALDARIRAMVDARVQAMMMSGAAQLPAAINDETLLDANQLRGPLLGGRSEMWLWRKQKDRNPDTKFPDPDAVIANRRYWRFGTVRAWLTKQAANGKTRGPAACTAAVGLILLIFGAPVERQIFAAWTPSATRVCASVVAATSVFPALPLGQIFAKSRPQPR
jgi:hypothetical protein